MNYVYVVWFIDNTFPVDDQDHETPALVVITSSSGPAALDWGDYLAKNYARRHGYVFKNSYVEEFAKSDLRGLDQLPVITEGHEATDKELGW